MGEYDIQVEPDESLLISKDIMRKQLLDLYNLTAQDPESGINKQELVKEITRGGIKDVEKFFQTPEQIEKGKQRQMEMMTLKGGGMPMGAAQGQSLPAPENGMTDKGMMQSVNGQNQY